jgi:bile acid:Na+ symporter, BASS family
VFVVVLYGRELLTALGSFAIGAQVIFILVIAAAAYVFGFGLNQAQRSAMSLGVCSRNGGAMFVAITAFPDLDPRLLVMILLAVPVPVIVWAALAKFFASRAGTPSGEETP